MRSSRRARRRGFTLMEVLLVLAILVILGSIVTVSVIQMQRKAYQDAAKSQLHAFESAIEAYQLDVGQVPTEGSGFDALINVPPDLPNQNKWRGPYFTKSIPLDPWDNEYVYEWLNPDQYRIYSAGPDRAPQTDDDITL
jgi:general secretion pathway protein G